MATLQLYFNLLQLAPARRPASFIPSLSCHPIRFHSSLRRFAHHPSCSASRPSVLIARHPHRQDRQATLLDSPTGYELDLPNPASWSRPEWCRRWVNRRLRSAGTYSKRVGYTGKRKGSVVALRLRILPPPSASASPTRSPPISRILPTRAPSLGICSEPCCLTPRRLARAEACDVLASCRREHEKLFRRQSAGLCECGTLSYKPADSQPANPPGPRRAHSPRPMVAVVQSETLTSRCRNLTSCR